MSSFALFWALSAPSPHKAHVGVKHDIRASRGVDGSPLGGGGCEVVPGPPSRVRLRWSVCARSGRTGVVVAGRVVGAGIRQGIWRLGSRGRGVRAFRVAKTFQVRTCCGAPAVYVDDPPRAGAWPETRGGLPKCFRQVRRRVAR